MNTAPVEPNPEREIGTWRRAMSSPGFWLRVIVTFTMYYWLFWERNKIVLTNRRITQYKPLLVGGDEVSIALENITEVRLSTPPLGALLGFADVRIQTAGASNAPEIFFRAIDRPDVLKEAIFRYQDSRRRTGTMNNG